MAQVCEAEGDLEAAVDLLDEAERRYEGDFSPNVRPVPALRARVWIRQGRLDDALAWVSRQGLSVTDDLSYLHEYEHVTLARALVAEHIQEGHKRSLDQALELLGQLLQAAQEGQRNGSVIDIRLAEALAHQSRGDMSRALAALDEALGLAEPEGYVRTFVDEGAPMAALLTAAADRGSTSPYVRRLRAALGVTPDRTAPADGRRSSRPSSRWSSR